jgi:hypothetical protein
MFLSRSNDVNRHLTLNRRHIFSALMLMGIACGTVNACAKDETLPDAIRTLATEKSAAEQYGVILATVGKADTAKYVRGIQLYADAKAEFDGLIAELRFELQSGSDLGASTKFAEVLKGAAEKRIAFTSYVTTEVVEKLQSGKPGLPDVLQVVPDLVKALTDAGLAIWKAFHDAGNEQRELILKELEQLQWKSFADLAKV